MVAFGLSWIYHSKHDPCSNHAQLGVPVQALNPRHHLSHGWDHGTRPVSEVTTQFPSVSQLPLSLPTFSALVRATVFSAANFGPNCVRLGVMARRFHSFDQWRTPKLRYVSWVFVWHDHFGVITWGIPFLKLIVHMVPFWALNARHETCLAERNVGSKRRLHCIRKHLGIAMTRGHRSHRSDDCSIS